MPCGAEVRPCGRGVGIVFAAGSRGVYTIFTNEQLAAMVQAKAVDRAALEKIAGVGDSRIEKYGAKGPSYRKSATATSLHLE